jgi:hypothetical protein
MLKNYEFSTLRELEDWINRSLEVFKEKNKVENEEMDNSFQAIKNYLENLKKLSEETFSYDYESCKICSPDDCKGLFCKCENRNIRVAREQRILGQSPWQVKNCQK